jgi:selenocysteine-specific elongation factor
MHVIATAGHVDHGKSTLVRALTGMEPDRWAEERRRGLTIDLGYAWTTLPSGETLAFVDVPGHQRFIANTLAGLGPAPAVLFVVAADQGWRQQSEEHLGAINALTITHGLLAVTRCDLADPRPTMTEALEILAHSSLGEVEAVGVSGSTGAGLDQLTAALGRLVARLPAPAASGRVRLWIDRAFTIRGSGVVVTGTLGAGRLRAGDELQLRDRIVRVRGLHCLGQPSADVSAVARVAVNLRDVALDDVRRGDALLTPGAWRTTNELDVRVSRNPRDMPEEQMLHLGTAALPVHLRPLGSDTARLVLRDEVALGTGDRGVLRSSATPVTGAGVLILDADPPAIRRRGAARARAAALEQATGLLELVAEVERRGAARRADLVALGVPLDDVEEVHVVGDWLVAPCQWAEWCHGLEEAVDTHARDEPLSKGLPHEAARRALGLPDIRLLKPLVDWARLESAEGRVRRPGTVPHLEVAEYGLQQLEQRLAVDAFDAPERHDLAALGLGPRELAAAAGAGRILRLPGEVVLLLDTPERAMRILAELPQPFTTSAARQSLGATRRVTIPLLEHLDGLGWTRRLDASRREVVR